MTHMNRINFSYGLEQKLATILDYLKESGYDHFGYDNEENQKFITSIATQGVDKGSISFTQFYWVQRYWDIVVDDTCRTPKVVFEK